MGAKKVDLEPKIQNIFRVAGFIGKVEAIRRKEPELQFEDAVLKAVEYDSAAAVALAFLIGAGHRES